MLLPLSESKLSSWLGTQATSSQGNQGSELTSQRGIQRQRDSEGLPGLPEPGRNSIPFLPQFFHTGNPSSVACVVGACGGWHWNPWIMRPISGFSLAPSRQQKSVFASERAAKGERVGLGCNVDATGKHWRRGLSRSQERLSLQPGIS